MSTTALEKIAAIEAEAKSKIDALKQEAVSELVKRIAAAKSQLATLEAEYASLTGKTLKGEKATSRVRLSAEEKAALVETVSGIIKAAKNGASFGEIATQAGSASASAVRDAIKQIKGLKTTGNKASTRYFLK